MKTTRLVVVARLTDDRVPFARGQHPIIEGVQLVNPSIHYGQGYLAISSDISYNM